MRNDVTGVVLAGGQSRRMGQDKRWITLEGRTLFDRALSVLEELFSEVLVVVAKPNDEMIQGKSRVVADLIPNCAMAGGLYTGLSCASCSRIFVVACDMPFLNPEVIACLGSIDPSSDVVMVKLTTGLQPLHAYYSKRCLPFLEGMLKSQQFRVQGLAEQPELAVRIVDEQELQELDPHFLSFYNLNTPSDLELAQKIFLHREVS